MGQKKKSGVYDKRLSVKKEWRELFNNSQMEAGRRLYANNCVKQFSSDKDSAHAVVIDGTKVYNVNIYTGPTGINDIWDPDHFICTCKNKQKTKLPSWGGYQYYTVCEHEAAVLMRWEEKHGPWIFRESQEEYEARIKKEDIDRRKKLLEKQRETEAKIILPAREFFNTTSTGGYFDVVKAAEDLTTTQFALHRAKELLKQGNLKIKKDSLIYGKSGGKALLVSAEIGDDLETSRTEIILGFDGVEDHQCSCTYRYRFYSSIFDDHLCEHELILLKNMEEIARHKNGADATDKAAIDFFNALAAPSNQTANNQEEKQEKEKNLVLTPRIVINGGSVSLTFKLGRNNSSELSDNIPVKRRSAAAKTDKGYVIKNLKTFVSAAADETEFQLCKTQTIDFSKEDFTESSLPWLTFVQRRVSESLAVNDQLQAKSYYYGSSASLKMQDSLTGALLDQFYETAEGGTYECQERFAKDSGTITVGHADMRVYLHTEPVKDSKGVFLGILITGTMPVILPGSSGSYILSDGHLSKITKEEEAVLQPFRLAASDDGKIRFRVGKDSLAEFYFRVVPTFLQSRYIDFEDNCAREAEQILPPEPEFLFRLDLDDKYCICESFVTYDGSRFNLLNKNRPADTYQDAIQEDRIQSEILNHFSHYDPEKLFFWKETSDDVMFTILTETVPALSRFGEVQGSERFSRYKVRSAPTVQVGVGIESGLMDISVISKDLSPKELLQILNSYRQKKKYHRLRSGDYIRLSQSDQLSSLDSMLSELNIKAEDVIGNQAHLPIYRALYLDAMLKKHEELASNRDRTYRALLKNFATIRDADYETPNAQADILRNYQVYGYKWLRTLTAAGFGGILADEMGLGKTIQAITLLQSLKDEGNSGISLIVCPASLVYNWQEEFRRFAPDLSVDLVVGAAGVRKNLLSGHAQSGTESKTDVLITSYDLFRKDVVLYEKILFNVMFLDEAQFIKNQKAAITKAVKTASARYRFALTGTPVENRLAELWSIFDFLMPGFLYSYQEFSSRFEAPIVKNKDEALSAQLRQMVSPFILRRLKMDVLKDLPDKLEEVRYTRFEEDQRKVYDGQVVHMKQMISGMGNTGEDKIKVLTELMRIRQICCDPSLLFDDYQGGSAKREACLELIQSAIGGGHRMLLFSQFTSMLELLEKDLTEQGIPYMKLTGATPKEQRIRMVREFNEGDTPVFLISLKAGGTGLNLTGADVVIHYDPWWNIAAQNQATDRAHRIGQTNTVTVYKLIVKDSIEEKILALQEAKRDLADSILSGDHNAITSLTNDELLALLG